MNKLANKRELEQSGQYREEKMFEIIERGENIKRHNIKNKTLNESKINFITTIYMDSGSIIGRTSSILCHTGIISIVPSHYRRDGEQACSVPNFSSGYSHVG